MKMIQKKINRSKKSFIPYHYSITFSITFSAVAIKLDPNTSSILNFFEISLSKTISALVIPPRKNKTKISLSTGFGSEAREKPKLLNPLLSTLPTPAVEISGICAKSSVSSPVRMSWRIWPMSGLGFGMDLLV